MAICFRGILWEKVQRTFEMRFPCIEAKRTQISAGFKTIREVDSR